MKNKSPFYSDKPKQVALKDYDKGKLYNIVLNKEKNGWECVVPIQEVKSRYDGSIKYKTVMRFIGCNT